MIRAYLLYEPGQAALLAQEKAALSEGALVVALTAEVEDALRARGISYRSARPYKQQSPDQLFHEDEMIADWFSDPLWRMFVYRDIPLSTPFAFSFRAYAQRVWYWGTLLTGVFADLRGVEEVVLFAPLENAAQNAGVLAQREIDAVVDCARIVAAAHGTVVRVTPPPPSLFSLSLQVRSLSFRVKRELFHAFLWVWNVLVSLLIPERHPRILVSDHWRNVASVIQELPEAECVFYDRSEIRSIDRSTFLRYRMRFMQSEHAVTRVMRRQARAVAAEFREHWKQRTQRTKAVMVCGGITLDPLLMTATEDLVRAFEKLILEIESTYAFLRALKPELILLRASVSVQTHFAVLPLVAKSLGIPSLELQHGLEHLGPGSLSREHAAAHMAVYGPLIRKELLALGYDPASVHAVGSPRFDRLERVEAGEARTRAVLCIAPDIRPFEIYDAYSAEDYFASVSAALRAVPDALLIIKLRSGPSGEGYLRALAARVFAGRSYTIAQRESLPALFAQAAVVVSCYSTSVLEALYAGVPTIVPAIHPMDRFVTRFHFAPYEAAGAIALPSTDAALEHSLQRLSQDEAARTVMRRSAQAFLQEHFCFDSKASERVAALIVQLAQRSTP